jgi:hypothetical protein
LHPKTTTFNKKTRITLAVILFLNLFIVALTFYEIFFWGSTQVTTVDALYGFTIPDVIISIPAGVLAAIVQAYFAERAWKVSTHLCPLDCGHHCIGSTMLILLANRF